MCTSTRAPDLGPAELAPAPRTRRAPAGQIPGAGGVPTGRPADTSAPAPAPRPSPDSPRGVRCGTFVTGAGTRSKAHAGAVERATVVQTHVSVLIFLGDRVYKVRKNVTTPFLDFSTRELRLADCRREVELNRRLAPDVYLGVLDVVDESGEPVEHMVAMRRLPDDRRLSTMVSQPGFDPAHLTGVARRIAAFHEQADRSPEIDRAGSVEHLTMLWTTNLDETETFRGSVLDPETHARIRRGALGYLEGRHALLAERVAGGRIVDGHGDLLAEDIFCLDDGPRVLDCIEFDPTFRWGDVLYDTSFLAMDLEHLGRPDLAHRFLADYRTFTAETHPVSLEHWYVAYRALVRAKIACLRAQAGDTAAPEEAAAFLDQSARHLEAAEVHLVLVGGLPGTGKSTLARGLADRFGWDLVRTDEVRPEVLGSAVGDGPTPPFEGRYAPAATAEVYAEVLRRAGVALQRGDSVVLDASWLDPGHRRDARRLAGETRSVLSELCCTVDLREAEDRIRARAALGVDPSEATPLVLTAVAQRTRVPWEGALTVDTSRTPAAAVEQAAALVRPGRPAPT
jgi:aminoglycoside phosphotransferase family enzyme/predicted kinase